MATAVSGVRFDLSAKDTSAAAFASMQSRMGALEGAGRKVMTMMKGLGAVASLAALGRGLQNSVNAMDDMFKASQKLGVGVEQLSRLNHAANLSDVSFEALSGSMAKFNRNIAEVSSGRGAGAASALAALGVSVRDASGSLKSSDAVLLQVSEKFSGLRDGAAKTALAMELFGRAGADMIPMLNMGAEGLAAANAEADRLGVTMSETTARAAEHLNDNMTRLASAGEGLTRQVTTAMLPALTSVTDQMVDFAGEGTVAKQLADLLAWVMKDMAKGLLMASNAWEEVTLSMGAAADVVGALMNGGFSSSSFTEAGEKWAAASAKIADNWAKTKQRIDDIDSEKVNRAAVTLSLNKPQRELSSFGAPSSQGGGGGRGPRPQRSVDDLARDAQRVFESSRTAAERYSLEVGKLDRMLGRGLISQETYNRALFDAKFALGESKVAMNALMPVVENTTSSFKDVAMSLKDDVVGSLMSIIQGTQSAGKAFGDMADRMLAKATEMALDKGFTFLVDALFGGGGGTDIYGEPLKGAGGGGLASLFAGFFADGGRIPSGKFGIVGERGPELAFGPGTIVPAGGSGGGMVVNVINQVSNARVEAGRNAQGEMVVLIAEVAKQVVNGEAPAIFNKMMNARGNRQALIAR